MKVILLRPVFDGIHNYSVGSECTFSDMEALRLINMGVAVKATSEEPPIQQPIDDSSKLEKKKNTERKSLTVEKTNKKKS